jgi:tetratricopeptide (TPR) repeat protein
MAQEMGAPSGLLGRDREWAELWRAWSAVTAGTGGLLVLDGEAGVGKTALVMALLNTVKGAATTVWVSCAERAVSPPQGVVRAIAEKLGLTIELPQAGGDAGSRLAALADALADALAAAACGPVLIVADDVQWADEASLQVLAFAGPQLREVSVAVVATLRTGEPLSPPRRRATAALLHAGQRLAVLPLGNDAARALVERAAPRRLPPQVLAEIEGRAAGNPLFLRELAILAAADPGSVGTAASLPDAVRSVMEGRLGRLGTGARSSLEQLALCGDDLPWAVAAAALGCPVPELLGIVGAAVDAEIVQPPSAGRVRFTHPLVRDALAASVGYARRVRLHQGIGHQLEQLAASGAEVEVALVATQFCAAAPAGEAAAAVLWAVRAAGEAAARLAYSSAAAWYEQALSALALDPGVGDRLDLLLAWGDALEAAGERARMRSAFTEAFRLAGSLGDAVRTGRAALGIVGGSGFEIAIADDTQLAVLDEAIAAVGDTDPELRAALLARRSVSAALREPPGRRRSAAEEALTLSRRTPDRGAECAALAALCDALAGPAHVERRLALAGEMAEAAQQLNDTTAKLLALRLRAVAQIERGDTEGFDRTVDAYEVTAARIRQPLYDWYVPLWRGMRRAMAGDTEGARALADQAEAIGMAAESANAALLVFTLRGFLAVDVGEAEQIVVPDLVVPEGNIEPWHLIPEGYLAACLGDLERARQVADRLPALLGQVPEDSEYLPTLAQASRIVAWLGGHPIASALYDLLLPYRDRLVVEGIGAYTHGSVERFLGMLARVLGRAESDGHFTAARDAHAAIGAALLVRLVESESGRPAAPPGPGAPSSGVFRREGDTWLVSLGRDEIRVRDTKGMTDLAVLVGRPRQEVPALGLAGRVGHPASRGVEVLDDQAKAAYRQRLWEIDAEIADAEDDADLARLDKAQAERDFLIAELTHALGIGGRRRRMGDDVERARTAVTARIRDAIGRIDRASPAIGEHFRRSVRTGTYCSYDPPAKVDWRM